ncbi:MAG: SsrA-binding protein SmpB [Ignavibacteria bacterium]
MKAISDKIKIITSNRKANFQYNILQTYEAGLVLKGTEVKSLREGRANIQDAYAKFINGELWLINSHISEYRFGNINNHEPDRNRKLLLKKSELKRLKSKLEEKGLTLIPTKLYFKNSYVKIELALAQGKKLFDKRETIKKREAERNLKKHNVRHS